MSAILLPATFCFSFTLVWPTPNTAFSEGKSISAFIQPTSDGGDPLSGTFGGVRNNGYRFHEGLDIKAILPRTRKGEATDPVFAVMDGVVAHTSPVAGKSNYGRYIVILHEMDGVKFYTLYAHLAAIDPSIRPGVSVTAGTTLGTLGRSGAGAISKARSHVHLEIGLKYGDNFQPWYNRQKFGSQNYQGNFNGMNLEGFDPLAFYTDYKAGKVPDMATYIRGLPAAYMLRVNIADVPQIARENPALLHRPIPDGGLVGWDITFTWYGLPILMTPLTSSDLTANDAPGVVRLKAVNRQILADNHCRDTVKLKNGKPVVYSGAFDILEMMFGRQISSKAR
jgi:peptidoglycan LD-endopeptidase LytH